MPSRDQSPHRDLSMSRLSMIVAMDRGRVIGRDGQMPWHLPVDLAWFKRRTLNKPVIMGRRTIASIGRALPHRTNIILTRQKDFEQEGCLVAHDVEEAIALGGDAKEIVVIGGGEVYRQFIERVGRLYITEIQHNFGGDTFFPDFPLTQWVQVERESHPADERNPYPCHFIIYQRES